MAVGGYPHMLIFGLGNPDRCDDGIGHYCVENIVIRLQSLATVPLVVEAKAIFHLSIDELETAARFPQIFVFDASMDELLTDFSYQQVKPLPSQQFTTHLLTPEEFLYSIIRLFDRQPAMHLISVKGYRWEIGTMLSAQAKLNADKAIAFFFDYILKTPVK